MNWGLWGSLSGQTFKGNDTWTLALFMPASHFLATDFYHLLLEWYTVLLHRLKLGLTGHGWKPPPKAEAKIRVLSYISDIVKRKLTNNTGGRIFFSNDGDRRKTWKTIIDMGLRCIWFRKSHIPGSDGQSPPFISLSCLCLSVLKCLTRVISAYVY